MFPASLLSKVNLFIIILLIIGVLFLAWRLEAAKGTISKLETSLESYATSLQTANSRIEETNKQVAQLAQDKQAHEKKVYDIATSANVRIGKLEKNRAREALVVAKPGLVENKINDAFKTQQNKLSCVTGNVALCEE